MATLTIPKNSDNISSVVESFHLQGEHLPVPGDEMGKGAVALAKYL